jgi:hypothetical protein
VPQPRPEPLNPARSACLNGPRLGPVSAWLAGRLRTPKGVLRSSPAATRRRVAALMQNAGVARIICLVLAAMTFCACAAVPGDRYGDFEPAAWQLVGSVTPQATQLVIDVRAPQCGLAHPFVRTHVSYGSDNVTIAASVAAQKACILIYASAADVRCVVQLTQPVGNRQLIGPLGSPKPAGHDPNETAGPADTTERPIPGRTMPPVVMPTADGTCLAG